MNKNPDTQFHDQLKSKFVEVFTKETNLNFIHPFETFLYLGGLSIWPIVYYLNSLTDEANTLIEQCLTFRITLISVYVALTKKKRKVKFRNPYWDQAIILTILGILMHTVSLVYIILRSPNQAFMIQYNYSELLTIVGFLILMFNRFRLKHMRIMEIYVIVLHFAIQIWIGKAILNIFPVTLISIICFESIQWRIRNQDTEHLYKFNSFDKEMEKIKNQQLQQIKGIQEEIETKSQKNLTSRSNELLQKLRLLKYQQLVDRNDSIRKIVRKESKHSSGIQTISLKQLPGSDEEIQKLNEEVPIQLETIYNSDPPPHHQFQRRNQNRYLTSITDYQAIANEQKSELSFTDQQFDELDQKNQVKMTNQDIDDLLHLLSGRKDVIFMPHFLRSSQQLKSNDEEFSQDAKNFLLSHFTQREASFKYIDEIVDEDQIKENNEQVIDFNADFLIFITQTEKNQTREFLEISFNLFKKYHINQTLKIEGFEIIRDFLLKIESLYNVNLYHNSMHAIDVANSTAFFLDNGLMDFVDDFDAACLILSSIAHDVGHPGLNNGFLTTNHCSLALLFNDSSVLENYHASLLFQILKQKQFNIVSCLSASEFKGFRKYCINLILDTDLTRHFPLMNRFQNFLDLNDAKDPDKLLIMSMCIKCADVGHGAKELNMHKHWSRRIIEEFFMQGELEQYLKIPISPMCDRKQPVAKSQEGFLKAIVQPMFTAFANFLQNDQMKEICVKQIQENIEYWQKQATDEQFNIDTEVEHSTQSIESMKKFLSQPLQICI